MKTAIRPDFYFKTVPSLQKEETTEEVVGITDGERALFAMSKTAGWKVFCEYLENLSRELGETSKAIISTGASMEDIGRNTLVITLTQDIIDRAVNRVADAVEVCTNEQRRN